MSKKISKHKSKRVISGLDAYIQSKDKEHKPHYSTHVGLDGPRGDNVCFKPKS